MRQRETGPVVSEDILIGSATRPKPGETFNGDTSLFQNISGGQYLAAVIDGSGHGGSAYSVSQAAKRTLTDNAGMILPALVRRAHKTIYGTRGAVICVSTIDSRTNTLSFIGVGNISILLRNGSQFRVLPSNPGILGIDLPALVLAQETFLAGDYLILHSDGISSRWRTRFSWQDDHPQVIADKILQDYSFNHDDATVVVIKNNTPPAPSEILTR